MTEAELRADFELLRADIQAATKDIPQESSSQKHARIKRLQANPVEALYYYFPHWNPEKQHPEADKCLRFAVNHRKYTMMRMWPRGHKKTQSAAVETPMLRKSHRLFGCMALVAINEKMAKIQLGELQAELEGNERYINDFGTQKRHGDWADGEFITQDRVKFIAQGIGQPIRGVKSNANRLDYAVVDDIDTLKRMKNYDQVRELFGWVKQDLMGAKGPQGLALEFCNNLYGKRTVTYEMWQHLLAIKKRNPEVGKGIYISKFAALDKDGKPVWHWVYTPEFFAEEMELQGPVDFAKNYLHDTSEPGKVFKPEMLPWRQPLKLREYDQVLCYHDVAYSDNDSADYNAIVYVGRKGTRFDVLGAYLRRSLLKAAMHYMYLQYVRVQNSQPETWLRNIQERQFADHFTRREKQELDEEFGFVLPLEYDDLRIRPGARDKDSRILSMLSLFASGHVGFNAKLESDADMLLLREHLLSWAPGSQIPDDGLDALSSALYHLNLSSPRSSNSASPILSTPSDNLFY
jgi:phage terminase large subunit-like protein